MAYKLRLSLKQEEKKKRGKKEEKRCQNQAFAPTCYNIISIRKSFLSRAAIMSSTTASTESIVDKMLHPKTTETVSYTHLY